jgi:DNA recombination protein RmuC
MSGLVLLAALAGLAVGAMAALLWRGRSEQALRVELERLRAKIASEADALAERDLAMQRMREQLTAAFSDLARDSLESNSEIFLRLARERLAREQADAASSLKEREVAIDALVKPLREALDKAEAQIQTIERERIDAFAGIKSQMEMLAGGQLALSRETRNLVTALRRPDVRGRWGEMTLRRLVELAGLSAHADFSEQQQLFTESGAVRPDMVVHMPERRDIVVDVKTPLDAYLAAIEAQSEDDRTRELKRHAQIVGARVRELSSKQYWSQFEHSPDFVVMFLPGDQFLSAALQVNPDLIDESLRQNVMLATPTSLVALLKTVALGWKQAALAENAAQIRKLGEDMFKRLAVFGEHLGRLGKSLGSSVDSFNKAVGSLETQVLTAARRFPELGLRVNREIEMLEPIEAAPRVPRALAPDESASSSDASHSEIS